MGDDKPEMVIAYGACALSGAFMGLLFGLLLGWAIWG